MDDLANLFHAHGYTVAMVPAESQSLPGDYALGDFCKTRTASGALSIIDHDASEACVTLADSHSYDDRDGWCLMAILQAEERCGTDPDWHARIHYPFLVHVKIRRFE